MTTTNLVVRELAINYLWPQYSLPWNNFFRRIDAIPFNVKNELRNINIRQVHSPLTYNSRPSASVATATVPVWTQLNDIASKPITSTAAKVFVGTYFDTSADINGLQYQYDFMGNQVFVKQGGVSATGGLLYLALDLHNKDPTRVNIPVGVDTATYQPLGPNPINQSSSYSPCQLSQDNVANNFWSTLTGAIVVNQSCSNGTPSAGTSFCLDTAKPYKDTCNNCLSSSTNPNTFYYVNGNRLYIAVDVSGITAPITSIRYNLSIRIVETRTPMESALDPLGFGLLPPAILY